MSAMPQESASPSVPQTDKEQSLVKITTLVYALQAASFIFGITYIIAVIINYVKKRRCKRDMAGVSLYMADKDIWYSLLFGIIGAITAFLS